jgi:uncharacterized protein Veg
MRGATRAAIGDRTMKKIKKKPVFLTTEQKANIPILREQGLKLREIAKMYHCGTSAVSFHCQIKNVRNITRSITRSIKEPTVHIPYSNPAYAVSKATLNHTIDRNRQAKDRLREIEPGRVLTLERNEGRRLERISGIVIDKYSGDKILIKNEQGFREMITFSDLLTMRVSVG